MNGDAHIASPALEAHMKTLEPCFAVIVRHLDATLSVHDTEAQARKAARAMIRRGTHAHIERRLRPAS